MLIALFNMTILAAPFPEVSQLPAQTGLPDPLTMFNGERVTSSAQWLNQRQPELKALFTSGYSERFIKDRGATQEGVALLSKPYRSQNLAEAVRAALDAAPHG